MVNIQIYKKTDVFFHIYIMTEISKEFLWNQNTTSQKKDTRQCDKHDWSGMHDYKITENVVIKHTVYVNII